MILPIDFKHRISHVCREAINRLQKEGPRYALLLALIITNYIVRFLKSKTFSFQNKHYQYFYHPYNHTWVNERAAEMPIAMGYIKSQKAEMLEIGNVLRHYFPAMKHDVIDKGEKYPGVINKDVADFASNKKYDIIVSISTMEHVGWDEEAKDSKKIPCAIKNLKKHLKKGGKIIITAPLDYNPFLDKLIAEKKLCQKAFFLKRKIFNIWRQTSWEEARKLKYNKNITARALAVLIING